MKKINLIGKYYCVIEETQPDGICRIFMNEKPAQFCATKLEEMTKRKFFVKKIFSWEIGKDLLEIITKVGSTQTKLYINKINERKIFKF